MLARDHHRAGRIVADDTPQGLATRSRYHNAVSLRLEQPEQLDAAKAAVAALPSVAEVGVVSARRASRRCRAVAPRFSERSVSLQPSRG